MAVEIPRQLAAKLDPLGPHFCLVEARGKSPEVGGKEWQKRPINADDPKLLQWLSGEGNYGVVGGFDLVIVDIDLDELKTIVKERLPPTFTSANILTVKVGTNTPRGGDAGHGGETVRLLGDLFVNRRDCFCVQLKHGYSKVDEPLTGDVLRRHVQGEITVGSYQLNKDSCVKWLCFDCDPEKLTEPKATVSKLINVMFDEQQEADGVKRPRIWLKAVLVEASRYPDQSYHVWILFEPEVHAKAAQWLGIRILELAGLNPKQVEVFPKQTELTADRPFGNFVKLPFGFHQIERKWSVFLNPETFEPLPSDTLNHVQGISFTEADLTRMMGFQKKTHVQASLLSPEKFKALSEREEERAVQFLCKYWKEGYRNDLEMYFLGFCLKKGVAVESAKRMIEEVVLRTGDNERAARLALIEYHYQNRLTTRLRGLSGIREIVQEIKSHDIQ